MIFNKNRFLFQEGNPQIIPENYFSPVWAVLAGEDIQQGSFTCPVLCHKRNSLTLLHSKTDLFKKDLFAMRFRKLFYRQVIHKGGKGSVCGRKGAESEGLMITNLSQRIKCVTFTGIKTIDMRTFLPLSVLFLYSSICFSQSTFQRLYAYGAYTTLYDIRNTSDGGYIACGSTGSNSTDGILMKLDAMGIPQWSKHFGSWMGGEDAIRSGETNSGGYYILNTSNSYNPWGEVNFIVLNSTGSILLNKFYTVPNGMLTPVSVVEISVGDFVLLTLYTEALSGVSYAHVIRTDVLGNTAWTKTFTTSLSSYFTGDDMTLCPNGDLIIVGSAYGMASEIILARMDAVNGNIIWFKELTLATDYANYCSIDATLDGGFIISARLTDGMMFTYNILLIKTDISGSVQWSNWYVPPASVEFSKPLRPKIRQAPDNGYIVSGSLYELPLYLSFPAFILFDSIGNFNAGKYYKLYQGQGYTHSKPELTSSGGYIAAFNALDSLYTGYFGYIVKADGQLGTGCLESSFTLNPTPINFTVTSAPTSIVAGTEVFHDMNYGDIVMKYSDNCATNVGVIDNEVNEYFAFYPNPSTGSFTVQSSAFISSIEIYNMLGEKIIGLAPSNMETFVDLSENGKGIYLVNILVEGQAFSKKIIIQ